VTCATIREMKPGPSGSADPRAGERSDEARRHDVTAIRLGCKLHMCLHLRSADRFGAGWINDRHFDRNMKVLRQCDAHFLARPASAQLEEGDVWQPVCRAR
jgi:hypothetical protein